MKASTAKVATLIARFRQDHPGLADEGERSAAHAKAAIENAANQGLSRVAVLASRGWPLSADEVRTMNFVDETLRAFGYRTSRDKDDNMGCVFLTASWE